MNPEVERINNSLRDSFGIDTDSGLPIWRVVFADDQLEKRLSKYSPEGIELIHEQVFEFPKYMHLWKQGKWILEQLVVVPVFQQRELLGIQKSYEGLFPFQNKEGNPLPPKYEVCQFVISLIETARGKPFNSAKYTEDPEKARKELEEMEEYLWGNETAITDHTQFGTGVFVPSNYEGKVH